RHSPAPTRIERLTKKDAVSRTDHRLWVNRIGYAQPRRKAFVPWLLRIIRTVACRLAAASTARSRQPAGNAVRILAGQVDERKVIVLFARRRVVVPTQAVIQRQLAGQLP